jgi:fatty acid desaturase
MGTTAEQLANIGPRGRRRRQIFGIVMLVVGLAVALLDLPAASRWWLVAVFACFWLGSLGVLQARAHT